MSATSPDGPASVLARIDATLVGAATRPEMPALHVSITGTDPEHGVTLADLTRFTDAAFTLGVHEDSRLKATSRAGVVRRLETIPAPVPCEARDLPAGDDA